MDAPAVVLWLWAPAPLSSSASTARVRTTTGPGLISRQASHVLQRCTRENSSARVLLHCCPAGTRAGVERVPLCHHPQRIVGRQR